MILTSEHLVLIRAALQFCSEEMGPHGSDVGRGYLDDDISEAALKTEAVNDLRRQLQTCDLKYVRLSQGDNQIMDTKFHRATDDLESGDGGVASVLC